MSEKTHETDTKSQTLIHVSGAVTIAVIVALALMLARAYGHTIHGRQQQMIQEVALTDLKLIFDQEKKFHALHGFYTTDLNQLGIAPKKVLYKFGFVRASSETHDGVDPSIKDLDALKAKLPTLEMDFSPVTQLSNISLDQLSEDCPDCTANMTSFKAIAVANLDQDPALDVWTVDQTGQVVHVHDDFKKDVPPATVTTFHEAPSVPGNSPAR